MAVARRNRQQAIEVGSITDLLTAFRIRKDELGLNMTKIDALAGFQFGYTGKLFSSADSRAHRRLTDFSLAGMLSALECTLVLVPNDDDDGGERLKQRICAMRDAMRSASSHVAEPADIEMKKAIDALEAQENALRAKASKGGKRRWARYGKQSRRAIMKDLAAARWSDGLAERRKAKRKAAAVKAARARWDRQAAGAKSREREASRETAELPDVRPSVRKGKEGQVLSLAPTE